jgi:hypothetical protein
MWQPGWRRPTALGSLGQNEILAQKISGPKGSNPGGIYRGADGVERYVKFYTSAMQSAGEVLANRIYNDLGFIAPDAVLLQMADGKFLYASTMIPNLRPYDYTKPQAVEFLKGFPVDVLTMNWDVCGMDNDNFAYRPDGRAVRLDNGASFLSRARGSRKDTKYLLAVNEYQWFIHPKPGFYDAMDRYGEIAALAGIDSGSGVPAYSSTVARIAALKAKHGGWEHYVAQYAPLFELRDAQMVVEMLNVRLAFLQSKVR